MKGQTWIEFIIATSIFLLSIGFIFMTASGNLAEEMQKVQQQTSCLKAYELENLLHQPGVPATWDSSTGFTVFGLSSGKPLVVSNDKWLAIQNLGFANVSQYSTPSTSWNIGYSGYAFELKPDNNCTLGNAVTICRRTDGLNVTASSTLPGVTRLNLFFPFSLATLSGANEANDIATSTDWNGTKITLVLNTDSTDQDFVDISLGSVPNLVFIEQANIKSNQHLPILLGNVSLQDNFGAFAPPNALVCTTKVAGLLNLSTEVIPVNFELKTW